MNRWKMLETYRYLNVFEDNLMLQNLETFRMSFLFDGDLPEAVALLWLLAHLLAILLCAVTEVLVRHLRGRLRKKQDVV